MPIGVPRIIYCWADELPVQWTDIYNFIFRRRMVFLMQYLDDELCNQIVGLLINIHVEDRTNEIENTSFDKLNLFSRDYKVKFRRVSDTPPPAPKQPDQSKTKYGPKTKKQTIDSLLKSEQDLTIGENSLLEEYTLQKIAVDWLNWNAQFFDYQNEPYIVYLAQILSQSFNDTKQDARLFYSNLNKYGKTASMQSWNLRPALQYSKKAFKAPKDFDNAHFDIYSSFRFYKNITSDDYNYTKGLSRQDGLEYPITKQQPFNLISKFKETQKKMKGLNKNLVDYTSLLSNLANFELWEKIKEQKNQIKTSEKVLTQRKLRTQIEKNINVYDTENLLQFGTDFNQPTDRVSFLRPRLGKFLEFVSKPKTSRLMDTVKKDIDREYYKEQTERYFREEEAKKVFMLINSYGGSVGNGITIHDALQYIRAGSVTLALGVAASAASLALAGGTVGERFVTEACHTMIHQPECLTADHSVLTHEGWVDIDKVTLQHKIATLNTKGELIYQYPEVLHKYEYNGNLYHIETNHVDLLVTANHRMYVSTENQENSSFFPKKTNTNFNLIEASLILNKKVQYKKNAIWNHANYVFEFPKNKLSHEKHCFSFDEFRQNEFIFENKIPMNLWLLFFGLCQSSWNTVIKKTPEESFLLMTLLEKETGKIFEKVLIKLNKYIKISWFKKDQTYYLYNNEICSYLRECFVSNEKASCQIDNDFIFHKNQFNSVVRTKQNRASFEQNSMSELMKISSSKEPNISKTSVLEKCHSFEKETEISLNLYNKEIVSEKKQLPSWIWNLSQQQCRQLITALLLGNKKMYSFEKEVEVNKKLKNYYCTSYNFALEICRLALHANYTASIYKEKELNKKTPWRVEICTIKNPLEISLLDSSKNKKEKMISYKGFVYCLSVPNEIFYVQRNGKPVWTGNSVFSGQASDVWIDSVEILRIRKEVANIYSLSAYRPAHKILKDLDRDFYLTANETVLYGLADAIATNAVMRAIIDLTNKSWDADAHRQLRLLEARDRFLTYGPETEPEPEAG